MKRIFTYLAGFSLLSFATISCSKEGPEEMQQQAVAPQVISAKVPAGQTYALNLGSEGTASIISQAQHYQLSEVTTASNGIMYRYIPTKGYAGTDEVTLQQTTMSTALRGGCAHNDGGTYKTTSVKTIVLKLDIAN